MHFDVLWCSGLQGGMEGIQQVKGCADSVNHQAEHGAAEVQLSVAAQPVAVPIVQEQTTVQAIAQPVAECSRSAAPAGSDDGSEVQDELAACCWWREARVARLVAGMEGITGERVPSVLADCHSPSS